MNVTKIDKFRLNQYDLNSIQGGIGETRGSICSEWSYNSESQVCDNDTYTYNDNGEQTSHMRISNC